MEDVEIIWMYGSQKIIISCNCSYDKLSNETKERSTKFNIFGIRRIYLPNV